MSSHTAVSLLEEAARSIAAVPLGVVPDVCRMLRRISADHAEAMHKGLSDALAEDSRLIEPRNSQDRSASDVPTIHHEATHTDGMLGRLDDDLVRIATQLEDLRDAIEVWFTCHRDNCLVHLLNMHVFTHAIFHMSSFVPGASALTVWDQHHGGSTTR